MSHRTEFTVDGMTCGHCEASVKEELSELPGVTEVTASHDSGAVTVISDEPLDVAAIKAAVAEAGYSVAD